MHFQQLQCTGNWYHTYWYLTFINSQHIYLFIHLYNHSTYSYWTTGIVLDADELLFISFLCDMYKQVIIGDL